MRFLLKLLAAPVVLALTLFVWFCMGMLYLSSLVLGVISTIVGLLGLAVLVTYSVQNGTILLVIAFLVAQQAYQSQRSGWWARYRTCGMRSRTRCTAE